MVRHRTGRWDGTGYPDRPAGEDTPPGARIPAPADAFDVMVSMRTDKAARSREDAPEEAARCAGGQFDPDDVRTVRRLWTAGSALARAAARLGLTPAREGLLCAKGGAPEARQAPDLHRCPPVVELRRHRTPGPVPGPSNGWDAEPGPNRAGSDPAPLAKPRVRG